MVADSCAIKIRKAMTEKPQLVRALGLTSAVVLVISAIIGSGVFKKVAPMSETLQSPQLVMLCWLLAGLISLMGALSNAEVASLLADSGGEYVYFKKIYGRVFAFFYGWSCFTVMRSASIASLAFVFAESLNGIFHFTADASGTKAVAIALIAGLTWLNYRGLKLGEAVSLASTIAIFGGIAAVLVLGFGWGNGHFSNIFTDATPGLVDQLYQGKNQPVTVGSNGLLAAMFAASLGAFWGYEGWNNLGYVGGEVKNPHRNIPLALGIGVGAVMVTYLLVNFSYLYVRPIDDIIRTRATNPTSIAAVEVLRSFLGNGGALFIGSFILLTTFNCTNATILMASRIYYRMSSEGLFFKKAGVVHERFHTPGWSLVFQAIMACGLVAFSDFDHLTDMLIFASFIYYGATALGVFILRRRMPDAERPYKVPLYPVVPAIFVLFCAALVVNTIVNKPGDAAFGLGLIATGIPFYFWWNRK